MPDTINPQVVDAVAIANVNSIADQPAVLSNLALSNLVANTNQAMQNAVAHQQALNELGVAILARSVEVITAAGLPGSAEALGGKSLEDLLAELKASVEAFQAQTQAAKPKQ